jgi:phage shock protein E
MTKMDKLNEVYHKLQQKEIVLDVRSKAEFDEGHVPGVINIMHEEVTDHIEKLKEYKQVYIHCGSGKRAGIAMESLTEAGLTNLHCIDDSGLQNWVKQGYKIEK